jgi:hypothetical protein
LCVDGIVVVVVVLVVVVVVEGDVEDVVGSVGVGPPLAEPAGIASATALRVTAVTSAAHVDSRILTSLLSKEMVRENHDGKGSTNLRTLRASHSRPTALFLRD